jgi:hypothetical protein
VQLQGGNYGQVIDLPPECFDAALVAYAISTANPMATDWHPTGGRSIEVDGDVSGNQPGTVTAVADPQGRATG